MNGAGDNEAIHGRFLIARRLYRQDCLSKATHEVGAFTVETGGRINVGLAQDSRMTAFSDNQVGRLAKRPLGEHVLDEMDRAYFARKLADAAENARASNDEQETRSYLELAAEYQGELDKLSEQLA